jgi:autotransporter-associated beta strand protein
VDFATPTAGSLAKVSSAFAPARSPLLSPASYSRILFGGNNTYTGLTTVNAGTLTVANANALGSSVTGTTVSTGGALELAGASVSAEPLTITGDGLKVFGGTSAFNTTLLGSGALRASADSAWGGLVTIGANDTVIGVDASATLSLVGPVAFGNALRSEKAGPGTLLFGGNVPNTFTTTRGTFVINSGVVVLGKNDGNIAMPINVQVGDSVGGADADVLTYATIAGGNQIDDAANVTVLSSGRFDATAVNNFTFASSEVQVVTFNAATTGGTFKLAALGLTTANITYSTTPATTATAIQNALNTLLGSGLTTVTALDAQNFAITFIG